MMIKGVDKQRIEEYARSLLDAAKSEVVAPLDAEQAREVARFAPEVMTVLRRMREERDTELLEQIYEDLREVLDAEGKAVTVDVTTAIPMNAELRAQVRNKCVNDLGCPVLLIEHVEPKIIGGIILEIGGKRRDASIKTKLAAIRRNLATSHRGGAE